MMIVEINQLTIQYGPFTAVDQLSSDWPDEVIGLLGVNGAGKSSLMKGLLGLVPFSSGSIRIFGQDVTSREKSFRKHIGYMPEEDCLIPGFTALQMVRYMGELSGMQRTDAIQRAHEVLFAVGLGEARYRKVETYSTGMKQRVKLAQAIVHDPKLLLLDEPTSGMDPKGREEMLELILGIASNTKMSVVMATHILTDVERICNKVLIMHRGKLLKDSPIGDFREMIANTYRVRVDGDRVLYQNWLADHGCQISFDNKSEFDVQIPPGSDASILFKCGEATKTSVRKVLPGVQTLEDVFVKHLGEDYHAHL